MNSSIIEEKSLFLSFLNVFCDFILKIFKAILPNPDDDIS